MSDFKKIDFGEISAEAERERNPLLIESGFIDLNSAEQEAIEGRKFLFLGYKGSGKSSIGERIDLSQSGRYDRFVKKISLADFPFTPFSKIIKGDIEPEAKYPAAWSWILLIYMIESFATDAAATHANVQEFENTLKAFKELGVSPAASPAAIVMTSAKKTFSVKVPFDLLQYDHEDGQPKNPDSIFNFVDSLKKMALGVKSPNKHFLVIDGLDEILTSKSVQYKSLYALMYEASVLNALFHGNNVPFKIVILCRTDLFDKTPGPNKNKIRQPYAVDLDWYHDVNDPDNSMLIRGAGLRGKNSLGRDVDIFTEFLPRFVYDTPTKQYFLDMTRHTPRDFFQLLSYVQKFHKAGVMTDGEVKSGLRDYSIKYFFPEIHDELSGYAEVGEINAIFTAIAAVGKRDFSYAELEAAWLEACDGQPNSATLLTICNAMFDCSAFGNIEQKKTTHYAYKYRNRLSTFSKAKKIMLHRGLWKAMNIQ
ncbi:hypothetical protein [Agrobacterium sp. B1(2019)]|uniref:P-loop ATPase, Sll1717 family n=1 Tax=Agrobacterium sp. B1(2019) TaxID=2607032 RepID=UPI0011EF529F|nr:hypothetical protein [Agrobacterium sp. B1(2019)]TZG36634.1 hypothetical protein AGR1_03810 [Agrobacterium sp. B1(2019)]